MTQLVFHISTEKQLFSNLAASYWQKYCRRYISIILAANKKMTKCWCVSAQCQYASWVDEGFFSVSKMGLPTRT